MNSKDNVVIIGNDEKVANTVTAHYAKEKTSDLVRQTFGGGQLCNGEGGRAEMSKEYIIINPAAGG